MKLVRFIDAINDNEVYINPEFVVIVRQKCPADRTAEGICRVEIDTPRLASDDLAIDVRGELEEVVARLEGTSTPVKQPPLQTGDDRTIDGVKPPLMHWSEGLDR